jgi:hypothetical protein
MSKASWQKDTFIKRTKNECDKNKIKTHVKDMTEVVFSSDR